MHPQNENVKLEPTTPRSKVSIEDATVVTRAIIEAHPEDTPALRKQKIAICLLFIHNQRRYCRKSMWKVRMLLRGRLPVFNIKKGVITLGWPSERGGDQ